MNIAEYNKIVVVSLCDNYSNGLGYMLSQKLGMLFCNTKDLIEYELIDKDALTKTASKEYLENAEKNVLKHMASFENVVVSISYDLLIHNINIFKDNSIIVFLKLSNKFVKENSNVIDSIAYRGRTERLLKESTLCVNIQKTDLNFVCEKVFEKLGGIV